MKKKSQRKPDVAEVMTHIQEQLAVLDRKLDSFMTKSLTELSQALAASKVASQPAFPRTPAPAPAARPQPRPARPMYTVICYDCGKDCEIPFKPSGNRPVYCKECFAKRKSGQGPKVETPKSIEVTSVPSSDPAPAPVSAPAVKAKKKKPAVKKKAAKKKPAARKKAKKKK